MNEEPQRYRCTVTGCNPKLIGEDQRDAHTEELGHRTAKWPQRSASGKAKERQRNRNGYHERHRGGSAASAFGSVVAKAGKLITEAKNREIPGGIAIRFHWDRLPLSLNDRGSHWGERNRKVQEVRQTGKYRALGAINSGILATGLPITATLVIQHSDNRRRDDDNPMATLKPLCDGLVDAGVVPDDNSDWMRRRVIFEKVEKGAEGFELRITPMGDASALAHTIVSEHTAGGTTCSCQACQLAELVLSNG